MPVFDRNIAKPLGQKHFPAKQHITVSVTYCSLDKRIPISSQNRLAATTPGVHLNLKNRIDIHPQQAYSNYAKCIKHKTKVINRNPAEIWHNSRSSEKKVKTRPKPHNHHSGMQYHSGNFVFSQHVKNLRTFFKSIHRINFPWRGLATCSLEKLHDTKGCLHGTWSCRMQRKSCPHNPPYVINKTLIDVFNFRI